MFALFGRPLSSREKLIQGVRFNAGLELPMKPIKHMSTMATLDFTPGFPDRDMALPLLLQAYAFFLSLIPHGVLSCYPLSKSANIEIKLDKTQNWHSINKQIITQDY